MQDLGEEGKSILWAILAIVGGILGYMSREMNIGRKLFVLKVLFAGVSSAFVGFLVYLICREFGLSSGVTGIIVGVTSWMGTDSTIKILEKYVYTKLNISYGYTHAGDNSSKHDLVHRIQDVCEYPTTESGTGDKESGTGQENRRD